MPAGRDGGIVVGATCRLRHIARNIGETDDISGRRGGETGERGARSKTLTVQQKKEPVGLLFYSLMNSLVNVTPL